MAVRRLVRLNTGAWMPTVGLGTYLSDSASVQTAVDTALHAGYRHIDTAASYGNEAAIGEVLKDAISKGQVKRKDLFVTTKVPPVYLAPTDLIRTAEESLSRLGLNYVDLLLIHSPFGRHNHGDGNIFPTDPATGDPDHYHHDLQSAWTTIQQLVRCGTTRAGGVSNFSISQLARLWTRSHMPPANVQLECHLFYQQRVLRAACKAQGVVVTAYSPIGAPGRPARHRHDGDPEALTHPTVIALAEKHSHTPSQIIIRFLLQLGVCPLPKSKDPRRIRENFTVYDFSLDDDDMIELSMLNRDHKFFRFLLDQTHPEYPHSEFF